MRSFWDFIKVMVGVKPQTVKPDVYRLSREEEIPRGTRKEQVLWELFVTLARMLVWAERLRTSGRLWLCQRGR